MSRNPGGVKLVYQANEREPCSKKLPFFQGFQNASGETLHLPNHVYFDGTAVQWAAAIRFRVELATSDETDLQVR